MVWRIILQRRKADKSVYSIIRLSDFTSNFLIHSQDGWKSRVRLNPVKVAGCLRCATISWWIVNAKISCGSICQVTFSNILNTFFAYHITWHHITSYHIVLHYIASYHIIIEINPMHALLLDFPSCAMFFLYLFFCYPLSPHWLFVHVVIDIVIPSISSLFFSFLVTSRLLSLFLLSFSLISSHLFSSLTLFITFLPSFLLCSYPISLFFIKVWVVTWRQCLERYSS